MGLPTEAELMNLPKRAQAAFCWRCIKRIRDIADWGELKVRDSRSIKASVDAIANFAQGTDRNMKFSNSYTGDVIKLAEELKKKRPSVTNYGFSGAANTGHYIFDVITNVANTIKEALRLDPYQTMEASLSAIRNEAIYNCDTDPKGAVQMEINSTRQEAVQAILSDYHLLKEVAKERSWDDATPVPLSIFETPIEAEAKIEVDKPSHGYQVFISFKNLDENGNPTEDSDLAHKVYNALKEKGFQVFFSPMTLEKLGTSAYKRAIEDALDQCQVMVAVGTSLDHLESQWVRWEWDGFIQDMLSGIKPAGRIFTYTKGMIIKGLPRDLRQNQVFFHEKDELDKLCNFVDNALN